MLRTILRAALPTFVLMSAMIIIMVAVYETIEALAANYPAYTLSTLSLVFFSLMVITIVPSKLSKRRDLQDSKVQLPPHWRLVILDIISWVRNNVYSQILLLFGFVFIFWGISAAAIYSLRAAQASLPVYLAVILAGTFVGTFMLSTGIVLYRSALAPVDMVSDDGLESMIRALPVMGPGRIELLRKWGSGAIPPRITLWMDRFYVLATAGLGISAAAPFLGVDFMTVPAAAFASVMMILAIGMILGSTVVRKRSALSEALNTYGGT